MDLITVTSSGLYCPAGRFHVDAWQPVDLNLIGALILAPPSANGPPWMKRFGELEVAFASGWMRVRAGRRRCGFDRGFVMSDHADWPSLLRTIRETGARRVLATHGHSDALVRYLQEMGIDAAPLQTAFEGEEGLAAAAVDPEDAGRDKTGDAGDGELET